MKNSEYQAAVQRASKRRKTAPHAVSAHLDRTHGRVVVDLSSGLQLSFSPGDIQGLQDASAGELSAIEITPSGLGLYFPKIDADVYIPGLLEGVLGSMKWMAARLGAAGGRSTTAAKKRASRQNGRLGGRPRRASNAG